MTQRTELKDSLTNRIEESNNKLQRALIENTSLRKECNILKDRLEQMEMLQLSNNIIIMGIPEQQWENYELTKQQVFDMIAVSKGTSNDPDVLAEARKMEISYCPRVGHYNPNTT